MAGLLEDSVDQGQGAFQGLGAVAEQAARNQVLNTQLQVGRQDLARGLVHSLGSTIQSALERSQQERRQQEQQKQQELEQQKQKELDEQRKPRQPPDGKLPAPWPSDSKGDIHLPPGQDDPSVSYMSTPDLQLSGDGWTQGIASLFSRAEGGLLDNNAAPIGGGSDDQ